MTILLPLPSSRHLFRPALDFLLERCLAKCPRNGGNDRRCFIDAAMDCILTHPAPHHASRMTTAQETN